MRQQLPEGTLLHGGTYRIEGVLGQGSFGITYLAEHTELGRKVAIKEFFMRDLNSRADDGSITGMSDGSLSQNYCAKFRKEAINLSSLDHPNIVRVTDSFSENGTFYYVMDYIDGQNLNDYVKTHHLSEQEATDIIMTVADALIYMHEQKHMLHLDLKPGNVMRRSRDGHIFLIDFGLSKHYSDNGQPETSTTIGLGTTGYAPIEQGNVAKNGEFRPTIDVYALGATLYKLLTGDTPPAASDLVSDDELLESNLRAKGVSSGLIQTVCAAMCPSVKKRTPTVRAFKNSIIAYSSHHNSDMEKANAQDVIKQGPVKEQRVDERTIVVENPNKGQTPSRPRVTKIDDNGFPSQAKPTSRPQSSTPQKPPQVSKIEDEKHSIFSFEGRVNRATYWIATIGLFLAGLIPAAIAVVNPNEASMSLLVPYLIFINYTAFSVGAKRCHDLGVSGWYQMIPFYVLVMLFSEGSEKGDRYGKPNDGISDDSVKFIGVILGAVLILNVIVTLATSGGHSGYDWESTGDTAAVDSAATDSAYAPADSSAWDPAASVEDTTGYIY